MYKFYCVAKFSEFQRSFELFIYKNDKIILALSKEDTERLLQEINNPRIVNIE